MRPGITKILMVTGKKKLRTLFAVEQFQGLSVFGRPLMEEEFIWLYCTPPNAGGNWKKDFNVSIDVERGMSYRFVLFVPKRVTVC